MAETETPENQTRKTGAQPAGRKGTAAKKVASKTASKKTAKKTTKKTTTKRKAPAKKATPKKTTQAPPRKPRKKTTQAKPVSPKTGKTNPEADQPKPGNDADTDSIYGDFDALSEYLTDITGRSQEVWRDFVTQNPDFKTLTGEMSADPLNVSEAFSELMKGLSQDPGTVMQRQFKLWGDYAKLMANMPRKMAGEEIRPAAVPTPGDKRFRHKAWEENPMLDFVKQSYLIAANWLVDTVEDLEGLDDHEHKKAIFYTQQFTDALSPSNFAMLNPDVVDATLESKGENLLKGFKNLLEDLDRGDGQLAIKQADTDFFELGKNVATTPGKVVFENELMQLIQYTPTTEQVGERPLLIFPPWINKFYILDLQPANSFIKWMVDQGRTVFVVSWVNPGPELREKTFFDYIRTGLFAALDAVHKATGETDVDAIGYCIGGTMLSTGLAYMAGVGDDRIKSATFFTAQTDFTEAGDLQLFVDDAQLDAIAKQMDAAGGVLEGRAMATTFNMLRSNDLIWSFVIDNYLKGKDPAKFDLLFWNSDATRMPKEVHLFYLREFYQHNKLASGKMVMDGVPLDLGKVSIPIFMQAGETDHIAPYRSIYNSARAFGGDQVQYMLAGSGHIAGVVNHPDKKKYHHSTNDALPGDVSDWLAGADKHPGSWWPHWMQWLNEISPDKVAARMPGDGGLTPIEDAPGRYVKVKA
ncbi:MAG: class I poly(R)-hydroxyalkanoic acid synthase [Pseudomonadota bacterium]